MLPLPLIVAGGWLCGGFVVKRIVEFECLQAVLRGTSLAEGEIISAVSSVLLITVLTWFSYLLLIISMWILGEWFTEYNELFIALAVALILLFSLYRGITAAAKCIFYVIKHRSLNIIEIIKEEVYDEAYSEVRYQTSRMSFLSKIPYYMFGDSPSSIARRISNRSVDNKLAYIVSRFVFLCIGFAVYLLVYESLFNFVCDIDFGTWWDPFVWAVDKCVVFARNLSFD